MSTTTDRAIEVTELLRAAITEAHGLLKDIRTERREFDAAARIVQTLLDRIGERAEEQVTAAIGKEIKTGLASYEGCIRQAIDVATERVNQRFDTLAAIMMGEERSDQESLADAIRTWRARLPQQ